jgi:hypothetical protein
VAQAPAGLVDAGADLACDDGELVFVVWTGESEKHVFAIGTDTFVVRDDKIISRQSFLTP